MHRTQTNFAKYHMDRKQLLRTLTSSSKYLLVKLKLIFKSQRLLMLLVIFWAFELTNYFSVDTLFLTFLSALIIGARVIIWAQSKSPRQRVLAILVLYVCNICLFGSVYHFTFKIWPDTFSFSSEISEGKALGTFEDDFDNLSNYNREIFALGVIQSFPKEAYSAAKKELVTYYEPPSKESIEDTLTALDNTFQVLFNLQRGNEGTFTKRIIVRGYSDDIIIEGHSSLTEINTVGILSLTRSQNESDFRLSLNAFISEKLAQRSNMIYSLHRNTLNLPEWGLLDFLYFSAVTTTTLGYGDILPNSTLARVLVMLNTISGVFMLGFLVYWFRVDDIK